MDLVTAAALPPVAARAKAGRGFTLIELLVVLVIMGLMVGLLSAVIRPDDRALLRVEADRLAQLLDLAASEGRLSGNSIAWTADGPGYRFWRRNGDGEWSELRDNDLLRARVLPSAMRVSSLEIENMPVRKGMRLQFGPDDPTQSFSIQLVLGTARYAVVASPIGELSVVPGEGEARAALAQR